MSRTYAHTPYHVNARRDPNSEIKHNGCHLDPTGEGRFSHWETTQSFEEADWLPVKVEVRSWRLEVDTYVYHPPLQSYVLRTTVNDEAPKVLSPFDHERVVAARGTKSVYAPLVRRVRRAVYRVVDCDVDNPLTRYGRGCYYDSETAGVDTYGFHHKCDWSGLKRDLWYKPERQDVRAFNRAAANAYNTYGEAPEDEPYTPSSPRGVWGGGWVD